jgi:hypothetical protein
VRCLPASGSQSKTSIVLAACSVEFDLALAGVNLLLAGRYFDGQDGLQFHASTGPGQKIKIGDLIADLARKFGADETAVPESIKTLVFTNLAVSFNTGTHKRFRFTGEASLQSDGTAYEISVTVKLDQDELVVKDGKSKYKKRFEGTLKVGGALFTLDLEAGATGAEVAATWKQILDPRPLDLGAISGTPELAQVSELLAPPVEASLLLKLDADSKLTKLALACKFANEARVALLLVRGPQGQTPAWVVALGLKAPRISTKSLGALGKVLEPHDIALDKLVIMAASADAPTGEQLALDTGYTITKGFLLQGVLEFGGTSFNYPFECRLGGDQKQKALSPTDSSGSPSPVSAAAPSTPPASPAAPSTPAVSPAAPSTPAEPEVKNNVAVGRTIGPVTFRKARLELRGKDVYVLLDASLGGGGVALDLTGLHLYFPLTLITKPPTPEKIFKEVGVGLDGLSIAYTNPPLTISGGLARTQGVDPYVGHVFRGHLLIKAQTFQITVLGSYGNIKIKDAKGEYVKDGDGNVVTKPALFLYGTFAGVLGGPAAFFVTGLALGGGYNMRLALPPIEKVAEFPLVLAVTDPEKFAKNPNDAFDKLTSVVLPSFGDYWLAVGVKFDSFKMADSFALFAVTFGTRLQFALLGLTKLALPREVKRDEAALYAELAIRAVLDPDAGVFSIEGRLTQNSFVLAKELHLTGGFAFYVWFGKAKEAGDFVISLGGYRREFVPPAHYPVVPRVGIEGKIGPLAVKGEAYLAITPSCVMAGQRLEAAFETDVVLVAFVAYADFLIAWAPFYYDARIGIGISVTLQEMRSYKLELTASLHIWGPPFAGTAQVTLATLSFDVEFGDQSETKPGPLKEWKKFQEAFLPAPDSNGKGGGLSTIRIAEGLVREVKRENDKSTYRIVNPFELIIETESVVPCSEVAVGTIREPDADKIGNRPKIGVRPMAAGTLESRHVVNITRHKANPGPTPVETQFKPVEWSRKNFPEALWSNEPVGDKPKPGMIKNVPSGVVLRVKTIEPTHRLGPFRIDKFKFEPIDDRYIWWSLTEPLPAPDRKEDFSEVALVDPPTNQRRHDIREFLVKSDGVAGASRWNKIDLKKLTGTPQAPLEYFQAPPTCAALGQNL